MFDKYVTLQKTIGNNNYNELKISFDYQKTRINYFNGREEIGGLYVYLKPIKRVNGIVSCTLASTNISENGFKVNAISMTRKNTKKIEKFSLLFTDENLEKIRNLYENKKFIEITNLIVDLANNL